MASASNVRMRTLEGVSGVSQADCRSRLKCLTRGGHQEEDGWAVKLEVSYSQDDGIRSEVLSCSSLLCSALNSTCRIHRWAGPCTNIRDERTAEADS